MRRAWEYATYCDFGDPSRRDRITKHFSRDSALRAFKRWRLWYSHEGRIPDRHLWRCWQEKRDTREIINDTGSVWNNSSAVVAAG